MLFAFEFIIGCCLDANTPSIYSYEKLIELTVTREEIADFLSPEMASLQSSAAFVFTVRDG